MVDLRTPTMVYPDVFVPLHGRHQGDNAAVALTAAETFFAAPIDGELVMEGFQVVMPGRFEVMGHQPLVIIDGAHERARRRHLSLGVLRGLRSCGSAHLARWLPARPQPTRDALRRSRR